MSFIQELDRQMENAVHEINANLRASRAHSEARRGLFSIFQRKTGKYRANKNGRKEGRFCKGDERNGRKRT